METKKIPIVSASELCSGQHTRAFRRTCGRYHPEAMCRAAHRAVSHSLTDEGDKDKVGWKKLGHHIRHGKEIKKLKESTSERTAHRSNTVNGYIKIDGQPAPPQTTLKGESCSHLEGVLSKACQNRQEVMRN